MKRLTLVVLMLLFTMMISNAKDLDDYINEADPVIKLSSILAAPQSFKGTNVVFDARFHKIDDVFVSVYTPYLPSEHYNFSVWAPDAKLWRTVDEDFPFLYVKKGGVTYESINRVLTSLSKYEKVRIEGSVDAVFDGRPYISVSSIIQLEAGQSTSEKGLVFMTLAERATEKESYSDAAKLYLQAIDAGLCREYEGISYRRAGELNLKLGDADRSLELLLQAKKRIPKDKHLLKVVELVERIIGNTDIDYTDATPEKNKKGTAAATQKIDVDAVKTRNEQLRDDITELSNQKIDLLNQLSDMQAQINALNMQLKTQAELEKLRDEIKAEKEKK